MLRKPESVCPFLYTSSRRCAQCVKYVDKYTFYLTAHISGVRFEVFTAVTMRNGVFWDVTPSGSCKNRRLGGTLVTANVVPSSPILVALMMEALSPSEMSVLTRPLRRNIP
jgi:hypothetical protein